jgi:beta-glucosidase
MSFFLWGAATSSHQVEGDNFHNDWWKWENAGNIEDKSVSGKATDHWNRFEEDLELAKNLGLNSYRFS